MKKRLIFDVSTLMWWNRSATGIVRVCLEVFFWLQKNEAQVIYVFFVKGLGKYYSINGDKVMEYIATYNQSNQSVQEVKKPQKKAFKSIVNYLDRKFHKKIYKIDKKLSDPYRQFFKNILYKLKIPTDVHKKGQELQFYPFLRNKSKYEIQEIINEFNFNNEDLYLSIGLNWEFMQEKTLYNIKKTTRFKIFMMCYDLIPIIFPQFASRDYTAFISYYFCLVSWVSDYVLCISSNTQKDYARFVIENHYPKPKTRVFHLGSNINQEKGEFDDNHILTKNKFILYVSTIEVRKNHETIYNAYIKLIEDGVEDLPYMVFLGMHGWTIGDFAFKLENDVRINKKIIVLNNASDKELIWLYKNCLFTVYPSFYEGWGLPIGESLDLDKFCIASSSSSIPEVGGRFVDYIHPLDTFGWAEKLKFYIDNPNEVIKKEETIKSFYKPIKWENTVKDLVDFIYAQ